MKRHQVSGAGPPVVNYRSPQHVAHTHCCCYMPSAASSPCWQSASPARRSRRESLRQNPKMRQRRWTVAVAAGVSGRCLARTLYCVCTGGRQGAASRSRRCRHRSRAVVLQQAACPPAPDMMKNAWRLWRCPNARALRSTERLDHAQPLPSQCLMCQGGAASAAAR